MMLQTGNSIQLLTGFEGEISFVWFGDGVCPRSQSITVFLYMYTLIYLFFQNWKFLLTKSPVPLTCQLDVWKKNHHNSFIQQFLLLTSILWTTIADVKITWLKIRSVNNLTKVRPLFTLSHRGSDNSRLLIVFSANNIDQSIGYFYVTESRLNDFVIFKNNALRLK